MHTTSLALALSMLTCHREAPCVVTAPRRSANAYYAVAVDCEICAEAAPVT